MLSGRLGVNLPRRFLFLALLVCTTTIANAEQKPEQLAQQSAQSWLALVDSGKYVDSWQEAASLFRSHVSKEQWQNMIAATRNPLGKTLSRKLKSATYTTTLPGAPDGDYVVIQYDTRFEHKQSAIETITPMLIRMGSGGCRGILLSSFPCNVVLSEAKDVGSRASSFAEASASVLRSAQDDMFTVGD